MTPTGSCPRIRPGLTGYSPRTMWTSVPQIVVSVILMTASPGPGTGRGTSSTAIRSFPRKTTAFIVRIAYSTLTFVRGKANAALGRWKSAQPGGCTGAARTFPLSLRILSQPWRRCRSRERERRR